MFTTLLNKTCNIRLQAFKQGVSGAPERDPKTIIHAHLPCGVREMGGESRLKDGKETMISKARVYLDPGSFPPGFRLTTRHFIEIEDSYGNRILVIQSTADMQGLGRLWQVDCIEQPV